MMLTLRLIAPNDYNVLEDGQRIGRIRYAKRTPGIWEWHVQVHISRSATPKTSPKPRSASARRGSR